MTEGEKSWFERIGSLVSEKVADVAGHPFAQVGVILFCAVWWTVGLPTDILTAALSILAITLTQMVLNRQSGREADDHRRDVAMHVKLDELVLATSAARNKIVGIEEELAEAEITELREELKEGLQDEIDDLGNAEHGPQVDKSGSDARPPVESH